MEVVLCCENTVLFWSHNRDIFYLNICNKSHVYMKCISLALQTPLNSSQICLSRITPSRITFKQDTWKVLTNKEVIASPRKHGRKGVRVDFLKQQRVLSFPLWSQTGKQAARRGHLAAVFDIFGGDEKNLKKRWWRGWSESGVIRFF